MLNIKHMRNNYNLVSRRSFVQNIFFTLGGLGICGFDNNLKTHAKTNFTKQKVIGYIKSHSSNEISSSALGVGFETLDRKMFDPSKCYESLNKLGVKWARCQTGWNRCETEKGQYDFKWLDEVVDNLIAVGIQPWFNVGYGNALYTPGAKNDSAVGWIPENNEEAREGWKYFVNALAIHYKGRVAHYEIWNEPNVTPFWRPGKPTPEAYVAFIKRTATVLRTIIPDVVIIGGGFGGFPTDFLKECLKYGLAQYVNKISIHPYMLIPEKDYQQQVMLWRELLSHQLPTPDLWQGECGCPSTDYSVGALSNFKWTESRQARWLLRRVINDLRMGLEMTSWYHTCDQKGYRLSDYPENKSGAYFGLLRMDDYTPKPSYFAYQTMCTLFDSQTHTSDSATIIFNASEDTDTRVIDKAVFSRHGYLIIAYWLSIDVHEDMEERAISITISVQQGLEISKLVLIDPLNGEVLQLEGIQVKEQLHFSALPLKDYPMLFADIKAFEMTST